ncbi:hypothetical protein [Amycolatopsis tolypomycina]|uniref:hypothetical protein n=1 Tax=Amycolatopsis tolypomycina TaxID=208445 RepID=UPI0033B6AE87
MRIHTKRTLQVALVSGGLLMVGTGSASALDGVTTPVEGVTGGLQAARPLEQIMTGADAARPLVEVLHTVPAELFRQQLVPGAEVDGELPEHDLNAPLGRELGATELPVLPVDGGLPVHGSVSTRPLDPEEGTRVTGLHTTDFAAEAAPESRAAAPAAGLPLVGGLLPSTGGLLPTQAPALTGLSDLTQLTSLTGLTQPAGNTPLNQGGRDNTGAATAPVAQLLHK